MQITNRITPAVIQAATAMLSPYVPEISPQSLIAALRAYKIGESLKNKQEKPYTRKEVADLLRADRTDGSSGLPPPPRIRQNKPDGNH